MEKQKIDLAYLNVNRHGVLKVSGGLWFILIFQSRHWLLLLLTLVSAKRMPQVTELITSFSWHDFLLEVPTLFVLLALANRYPAGGKWARWLWAKSRECLSLSAMLHIGWTMMTLAQSPIWDPWPERAMFAMAIGDVLIVAYLWGTSLPKQIFSEFPASDDVKPSVKKTIKEQ